MNIVYIAHYAGSITMGMAFRPYYLAKKWEEKGHRVRIISASFAHARQVNPTVSEDFEIQKIDGVTYQWIKTRTYQKNGMARAVTLFEFCSKLYRYAGTLAKEFQPDVVVSSSTYPLDTYPAQQIKKMAEKFSTDGKKCKYIHEAHDLWPLTLIEADGWSRYHPFIQMLAVAERSAFSRSDAVTALAPNVVEYMLSHGLQGRDKFTHIPNGVFVEDWETPEPLDREHKDPIQELKRAGRFLICYLGGHAPINALDTLLDAAKLMREDNRFAFVSVGDGPEKQRLQKRVEDEEISNFMFLPSVKKRQVPSLLQSMDALYVGSKPISLYRYGVSLNKVYDYMMAARPILYSVDAWNDEIAEAGCGITVPPGDAAAIQAAAERLIAMTQEERAALGQAGRKWVTEHCDYSVLARRFLHVMEEEAQVW